MKAFRRVLLTNDDGIDAPGLKVLEEVALEIADEVWVVAPAHDQSGTSHSLSLHSPLRASPEGDKRFAITGTPADCVVMAARHLMPEPPEMLLSGVNRGANIGVETVFSGTVGAAMTGMLLGIPSIALSQAFSDRANVPWTVARRHAAEAILKFPSSQWSKQSCLNINFPDVAADKVGGIVLTSQGKGHLDNVKVVPGKDPRNLDYHWLSLQRSDEADLAGSEVEAIQQGKISITPLQFERTNISILNSLRSQ